MACRPTRNDRGMSMVEILVTLAVVTLMFGPIFTMLQSSHLRTVRGGDETIATVYAADVIELVRGGPYEAFFKDGGTPDKDVPLKDVFARSNFFKGYDYEKYDKRFTITVDVGPAGELEPAKMKMVTVKVTWEDKVTKKATAAPVIMATYYSPASL